jgi:hypothetical protein
MTDFTVDGAIDVWAAENAFYLRSPVSRIGKLLAHYEIYKMIAGVPGAVIECGVYKGASLVRFATFRALCETEDSRPIHGFDAFGAFPLQGVSSAADQDFIRRFQSAGGDGVSPESLNAALAAKRLGNVKLHPGLVDDTVPAFLEANPAVKIALLHLDLDVYEPTRKCLDLFAPRMARGGLIVFDDYTAVEGATRAADEFCSAHALKLEKLAFYTVPAFARV